MTTFIYKYHLPVYINAIMILIHIYLKWPFGPVVLWNLVCHFKSLRSHDQWLISSHLSNRHFLLMSFQDPSKGTVVSTLCISNLTFVRLLLQLLLLLSLLAFVFSCSVCPHWCHLHQSAPTNLLLERPTKQHCGRDC